jgi:hypothetical protein
MFSGSRGFSSTVHSVVGFFYAIHVFINNNSPAAIASIYTIARTSFILVRMLASGITVVASMEMGSWIVIIPRAAKGPPYHVQIKSAKNDRKKCEAHGRGRDGEKFELLSLKTAVSPPDAENWHKSQNISRDYHVLSPASRIHIRKKSGAAYLPGATAETLLNKGQRYVSSRRRLTDTMVTSFSSSLM